MQKTVNSSGTLRNTASPASSSEWILRKGAGKKKETIQLFIYREILVSRKLRRTRAYGQLRKPSGHNSNSLTGHGKQGEGTLIERAEMHSAWGIP